MLDSPGMTLGIEGVSGTTDLAGDCGVIGGFLKLSALWGCMSLSEQRDSAVLKQPHYERSLPGNRTMEVLRRNQKPSELHDYSRELTRVIPVDSIRFLHCFAKREG